jgi:hypothetical protein
METSTTNRTMRVPFNLSRNLCMVQLRCHGVFTSIPPKRMLGRL